MGRLKQIPIEQRIYLDESGINQYLHREYGRSLRGKKVRGEISGRRFARKRLQDHLKKSEKKTKKLILGTALKFPFSLP